MDQSDVFSLLGSDGQQILIKNEKSVIQGQRELDYGYAFTTVPLFQPDFNLEEYVIQSNEILPDSVIQSNVTLQESAIHSSGPESLIESGVFHQEPSVEAPIPEENPENPKDCLDNISDLSNWDLQHLFNNPAAFIAPHISVVRSKKAKNPPYLVSVNIIYWVGNGMMYCSINLSCEVFFGTNV